MELIEQTISKRERSCNPQIDMLVNYMEQHPLFARKQITKLGPRGKEKYQQMLNELTMRLNSIGPCKKDAKMWEKVWNNFRLNCKKRKNLFISQKNATGNIDVTAKPLTDLEIRVCNIFGEYGSGLPVIPEVATKKFYLQDVGDSARQRPNKEQLEHMYEFMKRNGEFAKEKLSAEVMNSLWKQLTNELNNITGPQRDAKSWRKSWHEAKKRAEDRYKDNKQLNEGNIKIMEILGVKDIEPAHRIGHSSKENFPISLRRDDIPCSKSAFLFDMPIKLQNETNEASTKINKKPQKRKFKSQEILQMETVSLSSDEENEPKKKKAKHSGISNIEMFDKFVNAQNELLRKATDSIIDLLREIKNLISEVLQMNLGVENTLQPILIDEKKEFNIEEIFLIDSEEGKSLFNL